MTLPTAPAAERNKQPILDVLRPLLPDTGAVLEIASGTGQHVCHFAQATPGIRWQPTEPGAEDRATIAQRIAQAGLTNVSPPLPLDVRAEWQVAGPFDAVVCINMIHISPWAATEALMRGAASVLAPRGNLLLYGPYLENGTAMPSNLEFDASLKRRNPEWGLRDLEEVTRLAATHGLHREQVVRMPANNLTVVFSKTA
jgi:cyclopropane fatty-acyl-phospholipid synthase-like methyltransferase